MTPRAKSERLGLKTAAQILPLFWRGPYLCPCILLGLPRLELLEQGFLLGVGGQLTRRPRILLEEFVHPDARYRLDSVAVKPLLGGGEVSPVLKRGRQRNLFPFRMEGRLLEGRKFREEVVHEISCLPE